MLFAPNTGTMLIATGLLFAWACNSLASDDAVVAKKLTSLGVKCEFDDDGHVVVVDFGWNHAASAADLLLLKGLDHLVELNISDLNLRSVGFKNLALLPNLKRLYASGTKCTDDDVGRISGLSTLEELDLRDTAVTDASIATFTRLRRLKWTNLSSTRVTRDGIRRLRRELPQAHVAEYWEYHAGIRDGKGVLDLDHAVIAFQEIRGSKSAGGGSGGLIEVSRSVDERDQPSMQRGMGMSFGVDGFGYLYSSTSRNNGIPMFRVGKHRIEVRADGTELVVDGKSFQIGSEKLRVVVDTDGVAKLDE